MLNDLPEWTALAAHRATLAPDCGRAAIVAAIGARDLRIESAGLVLDYSFSLATPETFRLLTGLARACAVGDWRDRMFAGERINTSEDRPVLHAALRAPAGATLPVDGRDIMPAIHDTLSQMAAFAETLRDGGIKGATGKPINTVINIGIGGSDLGPRMVCEALRTYHNGQPDMRFVSNVDPDDLAAALRGADPQRTLFIVTSKTFTTHETLVNARAARAWLQKNLGDNIKTDTHFVAVTANAGEALKSGIPGERIFSFGEWVGGRYSLWSAVGLPICIACGPAAFRALLAGAHAMDNHFRLAPLEQNMPVIMALLGIWYRNFWNAGSYAVLPYSHRLARFTDWLQQLDMESNGKSVTRDGAAAAYETGAVVFGRPGTDVQHAFFQMLHQGTALIPCELIGVGAPAHEDGREQHEILLANLKAQARALWQGRTKVQAGGNPHRVLEGARPSLTLMLPRIDPWHLGALLALYEHKVFVQGIIWNINSFDQWGVELGKDIARDILAGGS